MNLERKLRGALRSMTMWFNGLLLAAWPFAEQIVGGMREYMPELQPYLPADVFKWVGLAVVVLNIALRVRTTRALDEKVPS